MFLIFTTQLYLCRCNYDAIVSEIDKKEVSSDDALYCNVAISKSFPQPY